MLGKKLKELERYIEEIEKMKPIDFLSDSLAQLSLSPMDLPEEQKRFGQLFHRDVDVLVEKYLKNGADETVIVSELYSFLLYFLKRRMVEAKAALLGIERTLYKKEMGFLFKGKQL